MDEAYLLAAARYIELNPRARWVGHEHLQLALEQRAGTPRGRDDQFVKVAPLLAMIPDWAAFLNSAIPEEQLRDIRRHTRAGRPLGD